MVFTEVFIRQRRSKVFRRGRVRGDREVHHTNLEHNPESTRDGYSSESRRRAVEGHKERGMRSRWAENSRIPTKVQPPECSITQFLKLGNGSLANDLKGKAKRRGQGKIHLLFRSIDSYVSSGTGPPHRPLRRQRHLS